MELPQRTLPNPEDFKAFFDKMVEAGNYAKLINRLPVSSMSSQTLISGGEVEWSGEPDSVILIGYPYIVSTQAVKFDPDSLEPVKSIELSIPNIGIPLTILFWYEEYHGFACVRSDVYHA